MEKIILPECFGNAKVMEDNKEKIIIRTTMKTENECKSWLSEFERENCMKYIVMKNLKNPERCILHKSFICHHSTKNKKSEKYRNTQCNSTIQFYIKKVTRGSKQRDKLLKGNEPLCCVITILKLHSHPTYCAEAFKYLRISPEVKEKFLQFFQDGYSPSDARRQNENLIRLMDMDKCSENLANASINPTANMVYYLHSKWMEEHHGTSDPIQKVLDKLPEYHELGSTVKMVQEGDMWSALVITPVMIRNQKLPHSKELVFLDSSASCDIAQTNITVMSTATKAGAIPIGILLHKSQTKDNYQQALELFKETCPMSFGGNEFPLAFLTDDSSAERSALEAVWPETRRLLCIFHVTQAEWRWLLSNVNKDDRVQIMRLFQKVLYASSEEEFDAAVASLQECAAAYPKFIKRFEHMLRRKADWAIAYRINITTRNNNTNNFSEASIRVLKDIVLRRTKAFNVVALIDFVISVWDPYFQNRLLNVAHSRVNANDIFFENMINKSMSIDISYTEMSENIYQITSFTDSKKMYIVNTLIGTCTCYSGRQGGLCKHQCYFIKIKKIVLPNSPPVTAEDLHSLAKLAMGDQCAPSIFYQRLRNDNEPEEHLTNVLDGENIEELTSVEQQTQQLQTEGDHLIDDVYTATESELVDTASTEFLRVLNLSKNQDNSKKILMGFIASMKRVTNTNMATNVVLAAKSIVTSNRRRGSMIKVQPTAISRRRAGLARGSRRAPLGRPSKLEKSLRVVKKRTRDLSQAISQNTSNAKKH